MMFACGAAVRLGKLDAITLNLVHRADVAAIGTDDFHVLVDLAAINHFDQFPSGGCSRC
jgi:hypothetical protein